MKTFLTTMLFLSSLSFASAGVDGGGGKSVVCRDDSGKITSTEVLDIYEGKVQYGLNIQTTNEPIKTQMERAIEAITKGRSKVFQDSVLQMANFINLRKRILN